MKHAIWLVLLFSQVLFAASGQTQESILSYKSSIIVLPSSELLITEKIRVQAEMQEIRHGIFRDFPTHYRDRGGHKFKVGFKVREVLRDGSSEPYHVVPYMNGERLYIGDKNSFVEHGEHEYTISFTTNRQLGFFKDHDELYFNAIGHGWIFPILQAEARVTLPPGIPRDQVHLDGYTGAEGSSTKNYSAYLDDSGEFVFRTQGVLSSYEGMTIVLSWPKGFVVQPSLAVLIGYFLSDNSDTMVGILGFIALLWYYITAWRRVGRDPKRGTIIPLFEPPNGLSPAEVRYIMKRGMDNEIFASSVISMASKGAVTISKSTGKFVLRGTGVGSKSLTREELALRDILVPGGSDLTLENFNHSRLQRAKSKLESSLAASHKDIDFKLNRDAAAKGLAVVVLTCLLMWAVDGFAASALSNLSNYLLLGAAAVVVFLFFELLEAPTQSGRLIMDKIEGFKMYLGTAEREQLEMFHPPEDTPELFEKYLPYAIALGVDNKWSKRFANILAAAALNPNNSTMAWYSGGGSRSDLSSLGSSLGSSLSSAISSASTPPGSSSGGGGGGFSGGGGGGGGGGGW